MRLNPKEQEKLMLHMAGNLAKERKERGVKLNYVEAVAYISSELLELARDEERDKKKYYHKKCKTLTWQQWNKCNMFFYYVRYTKQIIKFLKYGVKIKVIKIYTS